MRFVPTAIDGATIVEIDPLRDERGFFARTWCRREFEAQGLNPNLAQCSISVNTAQGTLRGMHFQRAPHAEAKLVRCLRGAIWDVIVDCRPSSPSFRQWVGVELNDAQRRMLYIPEGVAHGFYTLTDESEVFYQISEFYYPESASGFRWDDPDLAIEWPGIPRVISEKDRALPAFASVVR